MSVTPMGRRRPPQRSLVVICSLFRTVRVCFTRWCRRRRENPGRRPLWSKRRSMYVVYFPPSLSGAHRVHFVEPGCGHGYAGTACVISRSSRTALKTLVTKGCRWTGSVNMSTPGMRCCCSRADMP